MKTKKDKIIWGALIAVVVIVIAVSILFPKQKDAADSNLVILVDTDQPIGCVGVSYARYDGSLSSEHGQNADNSLMGRGESLYFDVRWPVTVTVYADLQARTELLTFRVEEAPASGSAWQVTLYDGAEGLTYSIELIPRTVE